MMDPVDRDRVLGMEIEFNKKMNATPEGALWLKEATAHFEEMFKPIPFQTQEEFDARWAAHEALDAEQDHRARAALRRVGAPIPPSLQPHPPKDNDMTKPKPPPRVEPCKTCGTATVWIAEALPEGKFNRMCFDADPIGTEWIRYGEDGRRARKTRVWQLHRCPE